MQQPNIQQVHSIIEKVNAMDLRDVELEFIIETLRPLLVGFTQRSPVIPVNTDIRRGRVLKSAPKRVSDITYPPYHLVKAYGRLNRKNRSIFYGSIGKSPPFYEVDAQVGDLVAISRWRNRRTLLLNNIGYTRTNLQRLSPQRPVPEFAESDAYSEANDLIRTFFAESFCQKIQKGEEFRYKLSIAVGELFMQGNTIDGLLYPSLAHPGAADNVAIKPGVATQALVFVDCELVMVKKRGEGLFEIEVVDFAKELGSSGVLEWKGRKPEVKLSKQGESISFVSNGEEWIAHDSQGNRVDWQ